MKTETFIKAKAVCWLKNNTEWFFPTYETDLSVYDNVELLSTFYDADLFYAYNNGDKLNGRLFKGKWNDGIKP